MALTYGYVKCKIASDPTLRSGRYESEVQYHLHTTLEAASHSQRFSRRGLSPCPKPSGCPFAIRGRTVSGLVKRHTAAEYTRGNSLPRDGPLGRSQTPKTRGLRQPAIILAKVAGV
jgi:hypothetical protein